MVLVVVVDTSISLLRASDWIRAIVSRDRERERERELGKFRSCLVMLVSCRSIYLCSSPRISSGKTDVEGEPPFPVQKMDASTRAGTTHRPAGWCPNSNHPTSVSCREAKVRKGERESSVREREGEEKRREKGGRRRRNRRENERTKRRNKTCVFEKWAAKTSLPASCYLLLAGLLVLTLFFCSGIKQNPGPHNCSICHSKLYP